MAPKLALLYAAIEGFAQTPGGPPAHEHLRTDLAQAALNAVLSAPFTDVRSAAAFQQRVDEASRQLFAEAMARLQLAEAILGLVADIKPRLESKLLGWASGNLDDLKAQLAGLVPPGFLRDTPADSLAEYPRYLKALSLRADRALRDPVRDQARMLELKPFTDALAKARARRPGDGAGLAVAAMGPGGAARVDVRAGAGDAAPGLDQAPVPPAGSAYLTRLTRALVL